MSLFKFHASEMSGKFDSMATGKISIVKKEAEIDRSREKESGGEEKKCTSFYWAQKLAF